MLRAYIKGKLEFFKDTDDLISTLKCEHGIDISDAAISDTEQVKDALAEVENALDQINYVAEMDKLEDLRLLIEAEKRMSKANKLQLIEIIRDIEMGLDEHVEAYRMEALELLDIEL